MNTIVISVFILLAGWAIYEATCKIVDEVVAVPVGKQIKSVLMQYIVMLIFIFTILAGVLQYFLTHRLLQPLSILVDAMKKLKRGKGEQQVYLAHEDEITALLVQFNELVDQLEINKEQRHQRLSEFSHEFRTPLTNINGYLKALQTGVIAGDLQLFSALQQESKRLIAMVEQLKSIEELSYAEQQHFLQKESVEIVDVINQVVQMFSWTINGRNIEVQLHIEPQKLQVDVHGMIQVLSNLIDNAICYYEGENPIQIRGEKEAGTYWISVSGQGKGISAAETQLIFERFYRANATTHMTKQGAGLGLTISKQIIEQHKGTLSLVTDGNYHTFKIKLPIQPEGR